MTIKKLAIGLAVLIVVLGAGAFGAEIAAQAWMARQVDAVLAQPPVTKASHGTVRYSLWRRHLEIDDLAFETNLPELRSGQAGHIEIDGISPLMRLGAGGDLVLPAVTVRTLALIKNKWHQSFGSLSLHGVRLADGFAAPRGHLTASIFDRFSARRIEAHDARQWTDQHGEDVSIATAVAEDVGNGRIGAITGTKIVTLRADSTQPGVAGRTEIAKLHAAGLDLAESRPFDPTAGSDESILARLKHFRFDRLDVFGMTNTASDHGGHKLTVAHVGFDKAVPGNLGDLEIDDLVYATPQASIRQHALRLEGLAYAPGDGLHALPRLFVSRLSLDGLAFARAGTEIGVKEILVTMAGSLGKATGMEVKATEVTVPASAAPPLRLVGYDPLVIDYDARSSYDAAEGVVISTQHFAAHDAGEIKLSLRLSNYPAIFDAHDVLSLVTRLSTAHLDRFELRYDDASLVERLIKFDAAKTQRSVEDVRAALIARAQAESARYGGSAAMKAGLDAVIAFLRRPASLTLTVAPPQPVSFGSLMGLWKRAPGSMAEALGVSLH